MQWFFIPLIQKCFIQKLWNFHDLITKFCKFFHSFSLFLDTLQIFQKLISSEGVPTFLCISPIVLKSPKISKDKFILERTFSEKWISTFLPIFEGTVKPRNSGLLCQPKFFHYYGVFHYFDGTFSRKGHFDHSGVVHYFAGFHYFAVHYCGDLLY